MVKRKTGGKKRRLAHQRQRNGVAGGENGLGEMAAKTGENDEAAISRTGWRSAKTKKAKMSKKTSVNSERKAYRKQNGGGSASASASMVEERKKNIETKIEEEKKNIAEKHDMAARA